MGLHERYAKWLGEYAGENATATFSHQEEVRKQLTHLFDGMMKALYRQEGANLDINIIASDEAQQFITAHAGALDSSFSEVKMSDLMRQRLTRSNYIFSGMKTFHELNEAFPSLLDENGNRKSFERFLNDVRKIDSTYNSNYLRAEYNFVHSSAQMAARWEEFAKDGDRYNLQYRTAGDAKVRPEHADLNGVTLPMSDPFWEEFYPPNGWNCRCTVVQVRKSKYPTTDHDEAIALGELATGKDTKGIFRFNSGKEQKTMPDYNPYTIRRCKDCDIAQGKLKLAFIPDNELCSACQLVHACYERRDIEIKHGNGTIRINRMVDSNDSDYPKLYEIAEHFAKGGATVELTPKMSRPSKFKYECIYGDLIGTKYEGKCPDLKIDGLWYEHEGFITDNPKRAFSNMMSHGLKQSSRIIIDRPDLTERYMRRSIIERISRGESIDEVWVKEPNGKLSLLYKKTDG